MFTVIDIETTGLSKHTSKITEIAAAKVRNGRIIKTYQTLINPQTKIPSFITKLTGIDNRMVKDAPVIEQVLPQFMKFLGKDVFVAHNATFDFGFLNHNMNLHHDIELLNHRLCTRKLANRLFPDLPRKRLKDLCEFLSITNMHAHRAMSDVHATVQVLRNMLVLLQSKGISQVDEILKFEKSPVRKPIVITP